MKRCNACSVDIKGNLKYCPLCQNKLKGDAVESVYPINIKRKRDYLLFKILVFSSLAIGVVCLYIDFVVTAKIDWSIIVILGLFSILVSLMYVLVNYKDVLKLMKRYFIVLLVLSFIWYFATRNLVITSYVIPILCGVIILFNGVIQIILKDYYVNKYIATLLFDSIVGFIPLILTLLHLTPFNILANICTLLNIISLLALIVFFRKKVTDEVKKRLNIE